MDNFTALILGLIYNVLMPPDAKIPNNNEIDQALKEFEEKSDKQQTLETEISKASNLPKMVQLVIKLSGGTIKEQKQAEYVLLSIVIVNIIITIVVFIFLL